jgi:hypothetical protein
MLAGGSFVVIGRYEMIKRGKVGMPSGSVYREFGA